MKKLRSSKTREREGDAVWATRCRRPVGEPEVVEEPNRGPHAHLDRHHHQRHDDRKIVSGTGSLIHENAYAAAAPIGGGGSRHGDAEVSRSSVPSELCEDAVVVVHALTGSREGRHARPRDVVSDRKSTYSRARRGGTSQITARRAGRGTGPVRCADESPADGRRRPPCQSLRRSRDHTASLRSAYVPDHERMKGSA